jgi:hypothetical protein
MRNVLTGPGPGGRSTILTDKPIAELAPGENRAVTEIWTTSTLPPEFGPRRRRTEWHRHRDWLTVAAGSGGRLVTRAPRCRAARARARM